MAISNERWGDEDDDVLPPRFESLPDENGIKTIIEWKFDDKGNKIKTTKKVKQIIHKVKITKNSLERKKWKKFGGALKDEGKINITYYSIEDIFLEDPTADVDTLGEKPDQESIFSTVKNTSIVSCRTCGMVGHWTLKCPYKNAPQEVIDAQRAEAAAIAQQPETENKEEAKINEADSTASTSLATTGKYIPPTLRQVRTREKSDLDDEEQSATLRVTNISVDTNEDNLRDLFGRFGRVARIFLAKDRDTMQSRGFAFISFYYREDAQKAMDALQGHGYDHLILEIEWAKPSTKKPEQDSSSTFRSGYGKALPQMQTPYKR